MVHQQLKPEEGMEFVTDMIVPDHRFGKESNKKSGDFELRKFKKPKWDNML